MAPSAPQAVALFNPYQLQGRKLRTITTAYDVDATFEGMRDLITHAMPEPVPQGSLMAYLFRRFGHPNIPSDPYKDLASYLLSTPDPRLFLHVTPHAGACNNVTFQFLAESAHTQELQGYKAKVRERQLRAFATWIMGQESAEARVHAARTIKATEPIWRGMYAPFSAKTPDLPEGAQDDSLDMLVFLLAVLPKIDSFPARLLSAPQAEAIKAMDGVLSWYKGLLSAYQAVAHPPHLVVRAEDPADWEPDDPLRATAATIRATFEDLRQPVWIRDEAIGIFGPIDDDDLPSVEDPDEVGVPAADSAGFASGALGNIDPEAMAALTNAVVALGAGDPHDGLKKALLVLKGHIAVRL